MLVQSYVEHNGSVTLIADPKSLRKDLLRLDWGRARQLRQLSSFWAQEVRYQVALALPFLHLGTDALS